MKPCIKVIAVFLVLASGSACSPVIRKSHSALWNSLLKEKKSICLMVGGEFNGDITDDIAVIYKKGKDTGLTVFLAERNGFRAIRFHKENMDFIDRTDLTNARSMIMGNNRIEIVMPFDMKRILPSVRAGGPAALSFIYICDRVRLETVTANVTRESGVSPGGRPGVQTAHFWYNAVTGRLFLRTPVQGKPGSFDSRFYYRFVAGRMKKAGLIGDTTRWMRSSCVVRLENSPEMNIVGYGYDKWKGSHDISGDIYAGYDDEYFLVHACVRDDIIRQEIPDNGALQGDHVGLYFASGAESRIRIGLYPGDFKSIKPQAYIIREKNGQAAALLLDKAVLFSRKTETGYILEAKIPAEYLPPSYIGNPRSLFTAALHDADRTAMPEKGLFSSSLAGSGEESMGRIVWK